MRSEQILGVLVLALGLVACSDNDNADKTLTPSATNLSGPTATAPPALTATATSVAPRHILLDTAPRPQPTAVTRTIGGQPPSLFPAWDGKSTVIYDTVTATTRDLGPGTQPASFSPDGTKAAWAAGEGFAAGMEVFVVDLPSGAPRSLGPGRTAQFIDDVSIVVFSVGGNDRIMVDVASGMRRPYAGESIPPTLLAREPALPEGLSVEPWNPGDTQVRTYTVRDVSSNAVLLTFDAAAVAAAGKNELAVAAPPAEGRSNVYVINVRTGQATYLASARPDIVNWPFSATADAVLWTDGYCVQPPGQTTLFDRKSGELVRFDTSGSPGTDRWMLLTPAGLLAAGSFGATALIDPKMASFVTVIPGRPDGWAGDVSWSSDYRFASHGPYGGHGGIC
jgi:hypothetical protein